MPLDMWRTSTLRLQQLKLGWLRSTATCPAFTRRSLARPRSPAIARARPARTHSPTPSGRSHFHGIRTTRTGGLRFNKIGNPSGKHRDVRVFFESRPFLRNHPSLQHLRALAALLNSPCRAQPAPAGSRLSSRASGRRCGDECVKGIKWGVA